MGIEKIKWHVKGFKELRKSREVMSDLIKRGKAIEASAGPGYLASPFTGKTRGRVSVMTADAVAREDNARNNTLVRAIGADPASKKLVSSTKPSSGKKRSGGKKGSNDKQWFVTKTGNRVLATPAQIMHWTRND